MLLSNQQQAFKGYNNDKTCVAEPQNRALIRCAIPPELSDFYEFGGGPEAAGSRGGNDNRYLECKAIGDHLEFASFQDKVRTERNIDSADLMIIMKAFANFIQHRVKNVLIIAGDRDFGNLLRTSMKKKNVNLMLAYPEKGSAFFKDEACTTFKWTVERSFDAPELMINGGRG
ncbi:unnamed protein product [Brassica rapa]|uniref:NYN domain-containing protein n=1 Tax=Brassica campestris TaxID=3711 RepID=A0A3P5ZWN3_BRACM|nr:unnamed protein product [Brassica rapa]VDC84662.1 unnamed protein product [Brassica rapa]